MEDKDLQIQALQNMLTQKDQIIFQLNVALIKANTPADKLMESVT